VSLVAKGSLPEQLEEENWREMANPNSPGKQLMQKQIQKG